MEGLIRLVAESFVRHGLDVEPAADRQPSSHPVDATLRPTQAPASEALLEHNYRKKSETDPATPV